MFGKGAKWSTLIKGHFHKLANKLSFKKRFSFREYFARLQTSDKRLLSVATLVTISSLGLVFTFSNCGQVSFNALTPTSKSGSTSSPGTASQTACVGVPPDTSKKIPCPSDASGLTQVTLTRDVSCNQDGSWSSDLWSDPNYSICPCTIIGQRPDAFSGTCACSPGQVNVNGACKIDDSCTSSVETETHSCPTDGSSGFAIRERTVTRIKDTITNSCEESPGNWSAWNYSQCSCPLVGQIKSNSNGTCECPDNQAPAAGACVPVACRGPKPDPITIKQACPSGVGTMQTVGSEASCPEGSTSWLQPSPPVIDKDTKWDTSGCGCSVLGQLFDHNKVTCSCTAGKIASEGSCKAVVCTNDDSLVETKACGGGATGQMTRTTVLSCLKNGTELTKENPGPWDMSACSCTGGRVFNIQTESCSCPSSSQTYNGTACVNLPCTNPQSTIDSRNCGGNASGKYTRSRMESCPGPGMKFEYGEWGPFNFESCLCDDKNAGYSILGGCACKTGFAIGASGSCEAKVCNTIGTPTEEETDPATGCGYRTRALTCSQNGTVLTYSAWRGRDGLPVSPNGYDYSQCAGSCSIPGQVHSRNSSSPSDCSCPLGKYEVDGKCSFCPSGMESYWEYEICTVGGTLETMGHSSQGETCLDAKSKFVANQSWTFCRQECDLQFCKPIITPTPFPSPEPEGAKMLCPDGQYEYPCTAPGPGAGGGGPGGPGDGDSGSGDSSSSGQE